MNSFEDLKYAIRHRVINKGKFNLRYPWYRIQYGQSLPEFYTTINVDPKRIERFVYPGFFREGRFPRFEDGNWDKNSYSKSIRSHPKNSERGLFTISDYDIFESIHDRYVKGLSWSETRYYSVGIEKIEEGHFWENITTEEDLKNRFSQLDKLYSDIVQNGYKSAEQLNKHISKEVTVSIGRDGEIFLDDGRHRLFIARVLEINKIPVWVLVRHREWQEKRQKWSKSTGDTKAHPDLQDRF